MQNKYYTYILDPYPPSQPCCSQVLNLCQFFLPPLSSFETKIGLKPGFLRGHRILERGPFGAKRGPFGPNHPYKNLFLTHFVANVDLLADLVTSPPPPGNRLAQKRLYAHWTPRVLLHITCLKWQRHKSVNTFSDVHLGYKIVTR